MAQFSAAAESLRVPTARAGRRCGVVLPRAVPARVSRAESGYRAGEDQGDREQGVQRARGGAGFLRHAHGRGGRVVRREGKGGGGAGDRHGAGGRHGDHTEPALRQRPGTWARREQNDAGPSTAAAARQHRPDRARCGAGAPTAAPRRACRAADDRRHPRAGTPPAQTRLPAVARHPSHVPAAPPARCGARHRNARRPPRAQGDAGHGHRGVPRGRRTRHFAGGGAPDQPADTEAAVSPGSSLDSVLLPLRRGRTLPSAPPSRPEKQPYRGGEGSIFTACVLACLFLSFR
mmetsp:Transcript_42011/g.82378  ORF Transcript_42011/g.82378 Transcript_42011/m.82378 type:complete len:290 (-) Transcript_42011:485-1354(-)